MSSVLELASFVDHFCYLCFVFVMLPCLFIATWERADVLLLLYHFPCVVQGQVWNMIVSISDLCLLLTLGGDDTSQPQM